LSLVKIREIKKFGINELVYDFSVSNYENFVANNICCHNTQDFARIMREQVNINPDVRYQQKTHGESGATE